MIEQENSILRNKEVLLPLSEAVIQKGVGVYFGRLGTGMYPSPLDILAACDKAESTVLDGVLSMEWLSSMNEGKPASRMDVAALKLSVAAIAPRLCITAPQDASELSPFRTALAAAVGAVGGMMVFTPLARFLLDMRDTGLVLGASLGAFLMVLAVWYAANNKWLRRILISAFGVAAIGELWGILTGGGLFLRAWNLLGSRHSSFQRVLLYVCVIFVLLFAKRRPRYDRDGYEKTVRLMITQWVDGVVLAMSAVYTSSDISAEEKTEYKSMLLSLVGKVQSLKQVPQENLQYAVEEIYQEIKNMGFDVEDAKKVFEWEEDMRNKYETFGHVDTGESVIVVREPICFDGAIQKKGLVRKLRSRD